MTADLSGKKIAIVVAGSVVERAEPSRPRQEPGAAGAGTTLVGKPVAAICHSLWDPVEAGVLTGRTPTSFPALQTDIRNAGGTWVDESAFTCPAFAGGNV